MRLINGPNHTKSIRLKKFFAAFAYKMEIYTKRAMLSGSFHFYILRYK